VESPFVLGDPKIPEPVIVGAQHAANAEISGGDIVVFWEICMISFSIGRQGLGAQLYLLKCFSRLNQIEAPIVKRPR